VQRVQPVCLRVSLLVPERQQGHKQQALQLKALMTPKYKVTSSFFYSFD
jgi:hypothetical protein